ncbi:MDIS1-interacting receptor like kinase 1-like [Salvia hispanica]|uniref:MDIS1-interacting receptor like kinase 1-like n=1 Tax=Salvia hispanica TaxID=49212 RepID=UPI00200990C6|nr:MDIS1-interacting receptor like kinase 1-like [Salvia hispanica]
MAPLLHFHFLFLFLIPLHLHVNSQNLSYEQATLLSLKQHWGSPTSLQRWNSTSFMCDWPEVDCVFGSVTGLKLAEKNIRGTIPPTVCLLNNIVSFYMSRNSLYGDIPVCLSNCSKLVRLDLSMNELSGTIPVELLSHKWLSSLWLQGNRLVGTIPTQIEALRLEVLDLSHNKWNGSIPDDIKKLSRLRSLDFSVNFLHGTIPTDLFQLRLLEYLSLGYNVLSGKLPEQVQVYRLEVLNLTHNNLHGTVPKSITDLTRIRTLDLSDNELSGDVESVVHLRIMTAVRLCSNKFSGKRLKFNKTEILSSLTDENLIGYGGSGKVYRVFVNEGSIAVAIKSIVNPRKSDHGLEKEFLAEIKTLGTIWHNNIVKLLCYLSSKEVKLLVYQYVENKSLHQWLHGRNREISSAGDCPVTKLEWPMRLHIAIGAAQGLCYMHHDCSPTIIHRDIKSRNILLDSELNAKIADFGLSKLLSSQGDTETASSIAGTFGYIPPEYSYTRKVNRKTDVYSFGVVLLELTTRREAVTYGDHMNLAQRAHLQSRDTNAIIDALDDEIKDSTYLNQIITVFRLGVVCTAESPSNRPSMKDCLHILQST